MIIKKLIPKKLLSLYHLVLAYLAASFYGRPSDRIIVIGVTGTNGKSTTVNLIAKILEESGARVGFTSTVNFRVGDREWLNDEKMTMLGRFKLQKLLRDMVKAGCKYAVIETSSEGIVQHRHGAINYDAAVFTNLTPEHIESHGGFENYKKAKGGQCVPKVSVVNGDDPHAEYFLSFPADEKVIYGIEHSASPQSLAFLHSKLSFSRCLAQNVYVDATGSQFEIDDVKFRLKLMGKFNVYNALAAIASAYALGIDLKMCKSALEKVQGIPGRLERIDEGQPFTVIIDYAPEPASMQALYEVVGMLPHQRIIHVLGSTGGGRDVARRPILGGIAARNADYVIVTNEDPYNDDPQTIIDDVARGAEEAMRQVSGIRYQAVLKILDRKEAIAKALSLAQSGDLVLITGKGAEQAMVVKHGQKIPWDDRVVTRELLH
ncbi:MAG: UDP-N-acetylmuramyl-tripeptide synthetase [Parcubacteria group bacterium GW2011_GWC2_45_7]|nr:MAG: UDP-N-acetylmuramyl-tripeptide synthetase [Parcubacteria group bacterium GW2011_GWC2_45_7]